MRFSALLSCSLLWLILVGCRWLWLVAVGCLLDASGGSQLFACLGWLGWLRLVWACWGCLQAVASSCSRVCTYSSFWLVVVGCGLLRLAAACFCLAVAGLPLIVTCWSWLPTGCMQPVVARCDWLQVLAAGCVCLRMVLTGCCWFLLSVAYCG